MIPPAGMVPEASTLLLGRALRAFVDGYVAVLLPVYLLALGFGTWEVGLLSTATLLGSALATLAVGAWGHRFHHRHLLLAAALLMAATGLIFANLAAFWPLLLIAFVGTLNPSSGDVSVFLPLEHARLAEAAEGDARTRLFARYSLTGALCAAVGALAAAVPDWLVTLEFERLAALRLMFAFYGLTGLAVWLLYRRLPEPPPHRRPQAPTPLQASRGIVLRLAALFSVDAFAGGLVVNSLLALWLFERFGLSVAAAGVFFFWAGLLTAGSQLAAPWVAKKIGLLNTMVFTHIPASICLILAALAPNLTLALGLLLLRAFLSQMDVPTRAAFVMAVVTPPERAAAASFTAVPRSLAAALSPSLGGALFAAGLLAAPLVLCGVLKIGYDLALLAAFRRHAAAK
ncbi:MAG: MFS transporter [Hydrogenophilales bacterium 28-61-23]|nr:MAG: MFS transporter [Hydrogenophilales bacterium 28-61-23]